MNPDANNNNNNDCEIDGNATATRKCKRTANVGEQTQAETNVTPTTSGQD